MPFLKDPDKNIPLLIDPPGEPCHITQPRQPETIVTYQWFVKEHWRAQDSNGGINPNKVSCLRERIAEFKSLEIYGAPNAVKRYITKLFNNPRWQRLLQYSLVGPLFFENKYITKELLEGRYYFVTEETLRELLSIRALRPKIETPSGLTPYLYNLDPDNIDVQRIPVLVSAIKNRQNAITESCDENLLKKYCLDCPQQYISTIFTTLHEISHLIDVHAIPLHLRNAIYESLRQETLTKHSKWRGEEKDDEFIPEAFADNFALFIINPQQFKQDAPQLHELFEQLLKYWEHFGEVNKE